jgi:hypothetical protein
LHATIFQSSFARQWLLRGVPGDEAQNPVPIDVSVPPAKDADAVAFSGHPVQRALADGDAHARTRPVAELLRDIPGGG